MEHQQESLKKKVKNVVIVNDFNYVQGGASKVAIDTAKLLQKENINVYFFSAVNMESEKIDGINYITTGQKEALKDRNIFRGFTNGLYNFKAKKGLKKLLKSLDKEKTVVHIHGWTKALSSSVFDICFKMNYKVVLTLHEYFTACPNGGYFNYKENKICGLKPLSMQCIKCNCDSRNYMIKLYRVIRQFIQNKIVKLNDKIENVISISQFSENILKATLGKKVKITRIYNPIDIKENKEIVDFDKNKYFLYVGRIAKEKGVDLFCQAITDLGLTGLVVGNGDEKEKLENKFTNIDFVGWKNDEEVRKYMSGARALIFPSRWYEGAGLTILEAQSVGIPCIVSRNCAGSDFIKENINGYLFDDFEDLKNKIKNMSIKKLDAKISKDFNSNIYTEKIIRII